MSNLKKYDLSGKQLGDVELSDSLLTKELNSQVVKDYIVAIRKNKRQWSASTKGRSEVKHTTRKPHPQKGTGKARQGSLVSPQFKGGGIVFGPKPKFDMHTRINKKERRKAVAFLLSEKIASGNISVLELGSMSEPKTKSVASFFETVGVSGKRVLFLADTNLSKDREGKEELYESVSCFIKSMRNIPKTSFMPASSISGYDVISSQEIIILDSSVAELFSVLERANNGKS